MRKLRLYNNAVIILFVLTITLLSGCRSKKSISTKGSLVEKNKKELISDVLASQVNYSTITGKANFELIPIDSKKTQKLTAVIKVMKGKAIQLSFRIPILGGEAVRVTVTPDTLLIIDRLKKRYIAENITSFGKSDSNFNYYSLEALLTNSLFLPGEEKVSDDKFKKFDMDVSTDVYLLKAKDKSNTLYNFAVDASDRIISTLVFSTKNDFTVQWSYKDFIKDSGYIYPTMMLGNINVKGKRFDVKVSYDKLDINSAIDIDMSGPSSKYTKISLPDIFKGNLGW